MPVRCLAKAHVCRAAGQLKKNAAAFAASADEPHDDFGIDASLVRDGKQSFRLFYL